MSTTTPTDPKVLLERRLARLQAEVVELRLELQRVRDHLERSRQLPY